MAQVPIIPLLLAILLTGCFNTATPSTPAVDPACPFLEVPLPHAGDMATYSARGAPWSMELNLLPILDWTINNGGSTPAGTMLLPPDSMLTVSFTEASSRLTRSGTFENAHGVRYEATRPGDVKASPFADSWIAKSDGAVVQATLRNMFLSGGNPYHDIRFAHEEKPAAFGMQAFWGRNLTLGATDKFDMASDKPQALWKQGTDSATWTVTALEPDAGGQCLATIDLQYRRADVDAALAHWQAALTLSAQHPMPRHYEAKPSTTRDIIFQMDLTAYINGTGDPLPAWKPQLRAPKLPVGNPESSFLAATNGVFITPWTDVMAAIRANPTSKQWLDAHPNAVPAFVSHIDGVEDSQFRDAWRIHWTDGKDGQLVIVEHRKSMLPGLLNESVTVIPNAEPPAEMPPAAASRLSLANYAAVFAQASGKTAEVLNCNFVQDYCGIGTHDSTVYSRYNGTWPSGSPHIGLLAGVAVGEILSDQSADSGMVA